MVKIELQPEQIKDVIEKYKSNYKEKKIFIFNGKHYDSSHKI